MNTFKFYINGLTCASCAAKIENEIKQLNAVQYANINILNGTATIISENNLINKINEIVKKHEPDILFTESLNEDTQKFPKHLILLLAVFLVAIFLSRSLTGQVAHIFFNLAYLLIYFITGKKVISSFFNSLKTKNFMDENFLMFIATAGAIIIGAYEEAAGVMLFFTIGEAFESIAVKKSNAAVLNLENLKPKSVFKITDEKVIQILPESIKKGDILAVKQGEIVPIDGIIIEGSSEFDLSSITGESNPVFLKEEDKITSGAIALSAAVKIKALTDFEGSTTSKIEKLIFESTANKSDTEKFITKFSKKYTPIVVSLAAIVFIFPSLLKFIGITYFDNTYFQYFYNSLIFLVISCPCALVLSVPITYFAGIGKAAKNGILVKGSAFLEIIRNSKTIVFDKTGTLTEGKFTIRQIKIINNNYTKEEILKLSASLEAYSTHPIASAFKNIEPKYPANSIIEIPGKGIKGVVNSLNIEIGNKNILDNPVEIEGKPGLSLYVKINNKLTAIICLNDNIKQDALETFNFLHKHNYKAVILSGDTENNVKEIAKYLKVTHYYHSLTPEMKINKLKKLQSNSEKIISIGDGINDAPLLTASDVGIAMGETGASLSVETADIIFLGSNISKLKQIIEISSKTHKIAMENIIFIMIFKIFIMTLGVFGYATLWEAVIADVGVALISVLNSMKVFRIKI